MTPLCFIDTETTGVHPGRLAWEIAMIRRDDKAEETSVLQVTDVDLSNADPFGLNIGRFYERHVSYREGPRFRLNSGEQEVKFCEEKEAAWRVEQVTRGAHLVGAVPSFDAATLDPMLRRHGLNPAWHYHLIDVEALAIGWLCGRQKRSEDLKMGWGPPWDSQDLSRSCGVEPPSEDERHTALGDARWAMRLYDAITNMGPT
jgi:hypothetical protein